MQSKKYIHQTWYLLLIVLLVVMAAGCTKILDQKMAQPSKPVHPKDIKREIILSKARNTVVLYFATPDGKNLVPVTVDVNPTEEMAKVATEKLLAGPADNTLSATIPEGTKLKDLYKFDNIAYVDLTPEFLRAANEHQADLAVQALVFTLTEFAQVDSVQLLIDGKVPDKKYGEYDITKTLHRPAIINHYGPSDKNLYKVYYSDSQALYMVPLTFSTDEEVTPEIVIEKLLNDPPKKSNLGKSPIWPGTKLLSVVVKDKTAEVNLSKEALAYGGGSANELNLVNSLSLTLTELPGIEKIQLMIEGKKIDYLPEGTDSSTAWQRPEKINYLQK